MADDKTTVRVYLSKNRVFLVADLVDFDTEEFPNPGTEAEQRQFISEDLLLVLRGIVHSFGDTFEDSDVLTYDFRRYGLGKLDCTIEISEEPWPVLREDR